MPTDNFFGADYVGYDPYGQQKADRLARYQAIDSMVNQDAGAAPRSVGSSRTPAAASAGGASTFSGANPMYGDAANYAMVSGGGTNTSRSAAAQRYPYPEGQDTPVGGPGNPVDNPGGAVGGAAGSPDYGPVRVPPEANRTTGQNAILKPEGIPIDVLNLRSKLLQNLDTRDYNPTAYTGNLTLQASPYLQGGLDYGQAGISNAIGTAGGYFSQAGDMVRDAAGRTIRPDFSGMQPYMSQMMSGNTVATAGQDAIGGSMMGNLSEMMRTGGGMAPMSAGFNNILQTGGAPNIQAALDAIKNQGMTNLQGTLGDITEQYSALGLGKGSDILGALGTGASKGIADIIAQQSQLSAQVNNAASDRMVSAGSVYGGMYNSMQDRRVSAASPMLGYGNMLTGAQDAAWGRAAAMAPTAASMAEAPAKYASMDADRAMQGAGIMSGIGSSYGGLMMQGADIGSRNLLQAAGLDMTLNENNMTRNYNDFLRMQGPSPWFDQAMQLATSYPNVNKPVVPSNNNTAAIVGALGQIGAASIPYIAAAASDRRLKRDVEPLDTEKILEQVEKIDISKWSYIRDRNVRHIGPMAQDFSDLFEVGDGKVIMAVDVFGVMLASVQALARRVKELEAGRV